MINTLLAIITALTVNTSNIPNKQKDSKSEQPVQYAVIPDAVEFIDEENEEEN